MLTIIRDILALGPIELALTANVLSLLIVAFVVWKSRPIKGKYTMVEIAEKLDAHTTKLEELEVFETKAEGWFENVKSGQASIHSKLDIILNRLLPLK